MNVIHHIAVICSDKEKALDFYHEKLGFPIIRENYRPDRDDWKIDLQIGDAELELFVMKNHPARVSNPEACGLRHLAFRVESVADTVTELAEKGIPCEPIRIDGYTGKPMTFFRDPDDLPIEIRSSKAAIGSGSA